MQFEPKLTLDGLMTLIAGLVAFLAVMIQICSSSKQLRDQMKSQHKAEQEEQKRHMKAVATALLFEIDGFYATYLRQSRDRLEKMDLEKDGLPQMASFGPNLFPVYHGNARKIGELPVSASKQS